MGARVHHAASSLAAARLLSATPMGARPTAPLPLPATSSSSAPGPGLISQPSLNAQPIFSTPPPPLTIYSDSTSCTLPTGPSIPPTTSVVSMDVLPDQTTTPSMPGPATRAEIPITGAQSTAPLPAPLPAPPPPYVASGIALVQTSGSAQGPPPEPVSLRTRLLPQFPENPRPAVRAASQSKRARTA